ncbi:Sphingomyelin phosphodiesterase 4 [Dillenia turbinata]|uniref:Sphingomyelin phosphodiesterase 4 n=1 Tax=Dillenia turbinata TaxID=194707 RepID=A0AAN8ZRN3_9MAGN
MISHAYTIDAHTKSEELAATLQSATTPSKISAAISAVDSFLHHQSSDQLRWFFSLTFPTLISKLLGFDSSSSSSSCSPSSAAVISCSQKTQPPAAWIDIADSDISSKIFNLFSPSGVLISSISAVDRQNLVNYVFPVERLPEWVRLMLQSKQDCRILPELFPLFKSRLKKDSIKSGFYQVQLNVFEYYMFWFAYYPVCRGNNENKDSSTVRKTRKFRLENWTTSIPGFVGTTGKGSEQKCEWSLYIKLLYTYLHAFVPLEDLNAHQPYCSSLLHYSDDHDGSIYLKAEFLVYTFVNFWLIDNDFSSLPVNVCKGFGVSFPLRSVLGEMPPAPGLGELVKLVVKYLNSSIMVTEGYDPVEYSGSSRLRVMGSIEFGKSRDVASMYSGVGFVGSWNSLIQRPLYRFILRTFLFCPLGTSLRNASEVFSLWVSYIGPWLSCLDDFVKLDAVVDGSAQKAREDYLPSQSRGYSSLWEGYILSNYLFYTSLVMHFIGFAHKFLHTDTEVIVQMVSKVMNILSSSKELVDLIKNVDASFHSVPSGGKTMLNSAQRFIPQICQQLEDWEDGLCESDADGSFLHENWNKDLRLFADAEDGGKRLLQLFILRAESELQGISDDNLSHNFQCLDSLKNQVCCLFGESFTRPTVILPEAKEGLQSRHEVFKPRKVGNGRMADVKYKGDWMKRPISSDEVAWLAKLLVHLSGWLNENLGLNQEERRHVDPTWSYVEVPHDVCGATETTKFIFAFICTYLLMLGATAVRFMIKHNVRVNLRLLASKKLVMVFVMVAIFWVRKRAFGLC